MDFAEKIWTASIWINHPEEEKIFFGSSLDDLRGKVAIWVINNKPNELATVSSDDEITRKYVYRRASEKEPLNPPSSFLYSDEEPITSGWVGADCGSRSLTDNEHYQSIEVLVNHLISSSLRIKKGPDWKDIEIIENDFPLYLIRSVKRVHDEDTLNDHLQSGWYLLSIDWSSNEGYEGRLESKFSEYVIGHTEDNATLPAKKGTSLWNQIPF